MDNKSAQTIQDTFLNTLRKDKTPITIYLVSGIKLTGKIRSFDKFSVLLENNSQEQLIFKHAISTVASGRSVLHGERPSTHSHTDNIDLLRQAPREERLAVEGSALAAEYNANAEESIEQKR
jgi:host factor-I protein